MSGENTDLEVPEGEAGLELVPLVPSAPSAPQETTLKDFRERRSDLQMMIKALLRTFEEETGAAVTAVELKRARVIRPRTTPILHDELDAVFLKVEV